MYNTITKLIFLVFLLSILPIDLGLGTKLSIGKGLSLKNIAMLIMVILIVAGSQLQGRRLIQPNSINKPIIFFIGYCILSLLFTYLSGYIDSSNVSYGSLLSAIISFKSFSDPFLFPIILYNLVGDLKTIKFLLFSVLLLYFASNFITILHSVGIGNFSGMEYNLKLGRTSGVLGEANQYAAFVALFIPLCVAAFLHFKSVILRTAIALLFFTGLYCILLTGSRGGLLSMIAGLTALPFFTAKKISSGLILKSIGVLLAIGILIAATFLFLPETSKSGIQGNFVDRASDQDLDQYSSGRLREWARGLKLFINNPIFGSGWGTYLRKTGYFNSHNDYLLYLASTGIIGLFLFVLMFYKFFKSINAYRNNGGDNTWYYNGYLAGLVSFCTSMFFLNMTAPPLFFFFIFSALILKMGYLGSLNHQQVAVVTQQ